MERNKYWREFFLVVCFLFHCTSASKHISLLSSRELLIDVINIQSCNSSWNEFNVTHFEQHNVGRYVRSFDLDAYFTSPIKTISKVAVEVTKCRDAVSFNTCEHFATWRYGEVACHMLMDEHAIWTPMVTSATPPLRCPFKENKIYKARNTTIDSKTFANLNIPADNSIFKFKATMANENMKTVACAMLDMKLIPVHRRNE